MAAQSSLLISLIFLVCTVRLSIGQTQFGTPPFCLISRQDVVPCNVTTVSRLPQPNEVGIYRTRLDPVPSGIVCTVIGPTSQKRPPQFRPITQIRNVLLMFSPGMLTTPSRNYPNNLLALFNIRCEPNQLAYFVLNNITLEDKNCFNNDLGTDQCVDLIQIDPDTKAQEVCGLDNSPVRSVLAFQSAEFSVTFRSSLNARFPGFSSSVVCLTPEDANDEGCTEGVSGPPTKRKKRNTDDDQLMKINLKKFKSRRAQLLGSGGRTDKNCQPEHFSIEGRNFTTLVPFGFDLIYRRGRVMFVNNVTGAQFDFNENKLLGPLSQVSRLETVDLDTERNLTGIFTTDALDSSGRLIRFPGLGEITVRGRTVMYELYSQAVLPTEEEDEAILELTSLLFSFVNEEPLPEGFFDDPPFSLEDFTDRVFPCGVPREKRQAQDTMNLAMENVAACNPVLRASAQAVADFMTDDNGV